MMGKMSEHHVLRWQDGQDGFLSFSKLKGNHENLVYLINPVEKILLNCLNMML